jgi:hypothetical protein
MPGEVRPMALPESFRAAAAGTEYEVMPLYRIGEQRYSIYWRIHSSKRRA